MLLASPGLPPDLLQLQRRPGLPLAPDALRPAAAIDPAAIVADPSSAAAWPEPAAAIAALVNDTHGAGGINPGDRRALFHLVRTLGARRILEIGTHIGSSILALATALQSLGGTGDAGIVSVDIADVNAPDAAWRAAGMAACPRDNLARLGLAHLGEFHAMPADRYMGGTADRFDLVFLDGSHKAWAVYEDVALALRVLRPGGTILLHDYFADARPITPDGRMIGGPFWALQRIMAECPAITVLPFGRLPWPARQGTPFTSLALVARHQPA